MLVSSSVVKTEQSIRLVAISSSALSVAYTVMLAVAATKSIDGSSLGLNSILSIGLALCFEAAKYSFMWGGFDLTRSKKTAALRVAGSAMLTISIIISIISIAASKEYIDSTSQEVQISSAKEISHKEEHGLKESATIKEYQRTLSDIGDKMESNKNRINSLIEEKQILVEEGYITKAASIERSIAAVSKESDELMVKRDQYLEKIENEKQKIKQEVKNKVENQSNTKSSVGKSATIVLAIVLELVSLLSVATYSLLTNSVAVAASIPEIEKPFAQEISRKKMVPRLPKYPHKKRKPKESIVQAEEQAQTPTQIAAKYCENLEEILQRLGDKKLTVKNVREELSCSQAKAHELHKQLKKIEKKIENRQFLN